MPEFVEEVKRLEKGVKIDVSAEVSDLNILEVSFKSTGLCGGDWGSGSRHLLTIADLASTGWMVRVTTQNGEEIVVDQPAKVEILFGGDAELRTLLKALKLVLRFTEEGMQREEGVKARVQL